MATEMAGTEKVQKSREEHDHFVAKRLRRDDETRTAMDEEKSAGKAKEATKDTNMTGEET